MRATCCDLLIIRANLSDGGSFRIAADIAEQKHARDSESAVHRQESGELRLRFAMTAQHLDCLWLCEIRKPSLRGAKRRSNPRFLCAARWIASRSLSSARIRATRWLAMTVQHLDCLRCLKLDCRH